jgi:hypothetical protein
VLDEFGAQNREWGKDQGEPNGEPENLLVRFDHAHYLTEKGKVEFLFVGH